jgi:hypothetical protein
MSTNSLANPRSDHQRRRAASSGVGNLMRDPRPLSANPFFLCAAAPSVDLLTPPVSAPQNGNVILQPEFRK